MATTIECKQCSTPMKKTKKNEHNIGLQLFGVVLFIIGLALLFVVPIGTVIGIFLMLGASTMGFKRRKIWKCGECGYFFERA